MSLMLTIMLLFCALGCGFVAGIAWVEMEMGEEFYVGTAENGTLLQGPMRTMDGAKLYARSCFKAGSWDVVKKKVYSTVKVY